jgi:hypothetical protein
MRPDGRKQYEQKASIPDSIKGNQNGMLTDGDISLQVYIHYQKQLTLSMS